MSPADRFRRPALYGLVLVMTVAFSAYPQSVAATGAAQLDAADAYRLAIFKLKGQLGVARGLVQLRAPGADYFLQERMQSIFSSAQSEFEQRDAPFTADFLEQLANASKGDPATIFATIESAANALDGSFAQTGAMDAASALALTESLLQEAVEDYGEAVVDNEVEDLRLYQSGRGLVTEAEALVRYHGGLKGKPGHEELIKAVVLIRQAWPGLIPPPIVFDPPSVAGRLDEAISALEAFR